MSVLEEWAAAVCRELDLPEMQQRHVVDLVLDVARDVAHGVARPAAPLSAYLLGVAVGRSADPGALTDLGARISRLAEGWSPPGGTGSGEPATTTGD